MVHVFGSELVKCVQEISVVIQDKKVAGHISLAQRFPVLSSRNRNTETLGLGIGIVSESEPIFQLR